CVLRDRSRLKSIVPLLFFPPRIPMSFSVGLILPPIKRSAVSETITNQRQGLEARDKGIKIAHSHSRRHFPSYLCSITAISISYNQQRRSFRRNYPHTGREKEAHVSRRRRRICKPYKCHYLPSFKVG
ncbi:hypothetical protein L249_2837, partial [Ophiocordyceps polyrhachis-furcata BCC 54312]